jgi:hypothetical protein
VITSPTVLYGNCHESGVEKYFGFGNGITKSVLVPINKNLFLN